MLLVEIRVPLRSENQQPLPSNYQSLKDIAHEIAFLLIVGPTL